MGLRKRAVGAARQQVSGLARAMEARREGGEAGGNARGEVGGKAGDRAAAADAQ